MLYIKGRPFILLYAHHRALYCVLRPVPHNALSLISHLGRLHTPWLLVPKDVSFFIMH
ncbi:uncharacterized protein BKA55DRAFT_154251 [Fusarium redolens]|uniref:Uncharacterized protein n=1 Tax=Fusarium redolens TaxID=48865 RepID=A0A9P9KR13_FUSRE|nr:uncharacterized protein BKA55DRAFT_154251 [Fusarium redolens]KAH7266855.1 hypothetical protein BKA55DRAFT_154251 [Fusarium redolens]